jgi:hypothetical protein
MTKGQRIIAIALAGALLLSGFAFGRWTGPSSVAAEKTNQLAANNEQLSSLSNTPNEGSALYLSDYQAGYREGFQAAAMGQSAGLPVATNAAFQGRAGYNEGFKVGFADGYKAQTQSAPAINGIGYSAQPVAYRTRTRTVSRPVYVERKKKSSKLKTALTIAAPAAIGAGVGAAVGGKKGAGVGALLGGGGGALYHLLKNRD